MRNYHNIERIAGRLVGYRKSDGQSLRITGNTRSGYVCDGHYRNTLREIVKLLETL